MFKPHYMTAHEQEIERKRKQKRAEYLQQTMPNTSTSIANDTVTFQHKHYSSMADALKEVRKNPVTHEDTTQVTRPNSKGLHR